MKEQEGSAIRGLKIRQFNICMAVTGLLLCVCLLWVTVIVSGRYGELIEYTENYVSWEQDASMVHEASDYLTEQARLFTHTGNEAHMENYFREVHVTKRREKVIEALTNYYSNEAISAYLKSAVQESNDLMELEYYAMKMVCVAMEYDEDEIPLELQAIELTEEDAALPAEEMMEKGHALLCSESYQASKGLFYSHITHFIQGALDSTRVQQDESVKRFANAITLQRFLLILLIGMNVWIFVVIALLVGKPLQSFIKSIKEHTPLKSVGAYEFRYLAQVYNDMYQSHAASSANETALRRKAEQDALTGVMNRGVFDRTRETFRKSWSPLALLLIDVDLFKHVNDTYGHEIGDQVLKKVAMHLKENFHSKDYLFRIGGDEFACIMLGIMPEEFDVIKERIEKINDILGNPKDGLPAVSLSVGVAFSEEGWSRDLYGQADKALYQVKAKGRCGCQLYGQEDGRS